MKFIIPATTLLYASVQAEDTTEAPEEIGGRKFNSIVGMAHSQITTSFSKPSSVIKSTNTDATVSQVVLKPLEKFYHIPK